MTENYSRDEGGVAECDTTTRWVAGFGTMKKP